MNDDEALSQLAGGDLSPEAAAALRARIDREPALSARWDAMGALVRELSSLPEEPAPRWLDEKLASESARRRPAYRRAVALALAVAAAAIAAIGLRGPPPPARMAPNGSSTVEGRVDVLFADATVEVDGIARLDAEPPTAGAREQPAGGPMSDKLWIAGGSATAGALVAVAVIEGSAVVSWGGQPRAVIPAGQTWLAPSAPGVGAAEAPATGDTPAALQAHIAALERELEHARSEADGAKLAGAIANGQLANVQGQPVAWPTDVPEAFRPERYEADVRAAIAAVPGAKLGEIDCSEYPCIALVTLTTEGDVEALRPALDGVVKTLRDGPWQGLPDLSVSVGQSVSANDGGVGGAVVLGIGAGSGAGGDVTQRTKFRLDTLMQDAGEDLEVPHPPAP